MKYSIHAALCIFVVLGTARADNGSWALDQSHSNVSFSVQHMVISEVTGRFKDYTVSLASTKNDFSDAAINAAIAVNSIDTQNDRRDSHLKSDDFFNAEKFPSIRFQSTSFVKTGDNRYAINGRLTIRDTTKEVSIDAVLNGMISSKNSERAGWKATLAIDRFDYGLKWNAAIESGGLVAGAMVTITLNLEFVKQREIHQATP